MNKPIKISEFLQLFDSRVPKKLAYDWDAVGLQVGDIESELTGILTTLDVTESVVDEAISKGTNLIMSHHPMMFKPMKQIDVRSTKGRIVKKCLTHNITIYSAHTNYDRLVGGMNDKLADRLNLYHREVLVEESLTTMIKLQVFIPAAYKTPFDETLTKAGIGTIGEYQDCVYETKGIGRFTPSHEATPYIGTALEREAVEEVKLEYLITKNQMGKAIKLIHEAHPYETPAYDLIPLLNQGDTTGIGCVGNLSAPIEFSAFINQVKDVFNLDHVRVTGDAERYVQRIAVLGGSGEKFINDALSKQADVYITGDLTFHPTQDAEIDGLNLIDAGHYLETVVRDDFQVICESILETLPQNVPVIVSKINTNPFRMH